MPKSVTIVSSLCRLEKTAISLHDTRPDAGECQDSNSMSLGAACQLVSGEVFAIRSSYGELVLHRSLPGSTLTVKSLDRIETCISGEV